MVTSAGKLPCRYVIHVVGPRCEKNQEDISKEKLELKKAVKSVLEKVVGYGIKSVCLLAISTGIFNFPLSDCYKIYADVITKFIDKHPEEMKGRKIILCKFSIFSKTDYFVGNFDERTTKYMRKSELLY